MRTVAAAAILSLLAYPAHAATQWSVDGAKSRLGFTVIWSGEPFAAAFRSWKADIAFDPADLPHSHISAVIDLASEASDTPDNDEGLKGPEGFSVAEFPTARFETESIVHKGGDAYIAMGMLSLHGVTKPVILPFTLTISGKRAHAAAKAVVLRTDFGLGKGEWAAPTPIAHAVTITLDLTAMKTP